MNKLNSKGFAAVEALLVVVVLGIVGFTGWFVWHSKQTIDKSLSSSTGSAPVYAPKKKATTTTAKADPNVGYLAVKEWGLRFRVPSGLADIGYVISGDTLSFYGKPTGQPSLQYSTPQKTVANVFRSTDSTKPKLDTTIQGKKIGSYYYYTSWSFSGLATGAGCRLSRCRR